MDLISIIVPIYKVEKYLHRCVDSILNQSYSLIEVILVDDGSPDKCFQICDEYAEKDKRIRVIHKKNGGLSDARNEGLKIAKGEYILFVDSDDYIHRNMIEIMHQTLQRDKSELVICSFEKVDEAGKVLEDQNYLKEDIIANKAKVFDSLLTETGWNLVPAWNKLYSRRALKNISFPKGKINEDEFVIHQIINNCNNISLVSEPLYYYVQRGGSIVNTPATVRNLDGVEALIHRMSFFIQEQRFDAISSILETIMGKSYALYSKIEWVSIKDRFKELMSKIKALINNSDKLKTLLRKRWKISLFLKTPKAYFLLVDIKEKINKTRRDNYFIRRRREKNLKKYIKKLKKEIQHKNGLFEKLYYIMATPEHGNLGDQAIISAEIKYLNKIGIDKELLIEIPESYYYHCKNIVNQYIRPEDVIIINGGGNLGTLWENCDDIISDIVESFSDYKIIFFPESCYYSMDYSGKKRLERNKQIDDGCKNLYITLRDKYSFDFFKQNFSTKVMYVPDIVLSLSYESERNKRKGVLLCLREDKERVLSKDKIDEIKDLLMIMGLQYKETSTLVPEKITRKNRDKLLYKKWEEFSSAKLVITDRLHGMIFSAITGTPCLAMDNINKKVSGVYEWIKTLDYIQCVTDNNVKIGLIASLLGKDTVYNANVVWDKYDALKEVIINEW